MSLPQSSTTSNLAEETIDRVIPFTGRAIRVLIVDDHLVIRHGLAAMLAHGKEFRVVGEASDGEMAVVRYDELLPDVVLLDLRMPKKDGFQVLVELMGRRPRPHVMVLSAYDGDEDVRRALKTGALAYLRKDALCELLWETVRQVHAGKVVLPPEMASKIGGALAKPELSDRELQVLQMLALGRSNKQVSQALFIAEGTTKTHVTTILEKLDASSRSEAIVVAAKRGLVRLDWDTA